MTTVAFARARIRAFRRQVDRAHYLEWEKAGITPREVFQEAGKSGFLGMRVPERVARRVRSGFKQILDEQIAAAGITGSGSGSSLHNDTCRRTSCPSQRRAEETVAARHRSGGADHAAGDDQPAPAPTSRRMRRARSATATTT